MSTNSRLSRLESQTADAKLSAGLIKHAPTLSSFTIAGTVVKTVDVITVLQSRQNTAKAVEPARSVWQAAVAADRNERAQSKALLSGVKQALQVMFAGSTETLADFGLAPRKARVVLPAVKVAAAAKAKATREARHTMGTKQKAQVKGALDGVNLVVTAQPSPTASPAATASPTPTAPAAGPGPSAPVTSNK